MKLLLDLWVPVAGDALDSNCYKAAWKNCRAKKEGEKSKQTHGGERKTNLMGLDLNHPSGSGSKFMSWEPP